METKTRRIETISETTTLLFLKKTANGRERGRCENCLADVIWLTPKTAAELAGLTLRSIYRLLETGSVHFIEAPQGEPQICFISLHKHL